jgi:spore coat polysaccharide biosynthesis predicted glycosyltransferase SpsG
MGHFYRALNLIAYLGEQREPCVVLINDDAKAKAILVQNHIPFEVVALDDFTTGWETRVINQYGIKVWINDRLDTDARHACRVKQAKVKLVTFDDRGSGASLSDMHIAGLAFDETELLQGSKILRGANYLVLNPAIDRFKRLRTSADRIVVSMGGSDTYGVTVRVVEILKRAGKKGTIILGPGFEHFDALKTAVTPDFTIKTGVPSLVEEFRHYDLAITAGGITPFEANASGLPCIVIASERHEIPTGLFLQKMGCSLFAGHYSAIDENVFFSAYDLEAMSKAGMQRLTTQGLKNIYRELRTARIP